MLSFSTKRPSTGVGKEPPSFSKMYPSLFMEPKRLRIESERNSPPLYAAESIVPSQPIVLPQRFGSAVPAESKFEMESDVTREKSFSPETIQPSLKRPESIVPRESTRSVLSKSASYPLKKSLDIRNVKSASTDVKPFSTIEMEDLAVSRNIREILKRNNMVILRRITIENPQPVFEVSETDRGAKVFNFTWNDVKNSNPEPLIGKYKNFYIPTYSKYFYRLYTRSKGKIWFSKYIPKIANNIIVQILKHQRNNLFKILKTQFLQTTKATPFLEDSETLDKDINYWKHQKEFMANVLLGPYLYNIKISNSRYVTPLDINENYKPPPGHDASLLMYPVEDTDKYGFKLRSEPTAIKFTIPNGTTYTYNYEYPSEIIIVDYLRKMRNLYGPSVTNPETFSASTEWILYHNLLKPYVYE